MTRTLTAASLALLLSSTSALALEGKALFESLVGDKPDRFAYGSIEETAPDSFVLSDVKMTDKGGKVSTAKTITFKGFREDGKRLAIGEMTASDFVGPIVNKDRDDGRFVAETFTLSDARAPREIFGGDIESVKDERVVVGAMQMTALKGDQDGDGTDDFGLARFAVDGLDVPLDWRMNPEMAKAATGPAAEPLTMASMSLDDLTADGPQGSFKLASFALKDLRVPTTLEAGALDWVKVYSSMNMGAVSFAMGDKPVFTMESVAAAIKEAGENAIESTSAIEGIFVDLTAIPDPKFQELARSLDYSELRGRIAGDGSYDTASGEVVVDDLIVDIQNVAKLTIGYKMSGYTPELANRINAAQMQASQGGSPNVMEVMALLGELMLESVTVELQDDSITKRLLDFQASQMSTTGDQLAAGAPMFIALGMGQLKMPEFTQKVAGAVGTFLQNPGTLTVTAKPSTPVSFAQLMQASQQAPRTVIEMLNVDVTAQ